ncbi:hypothetical protein ACM26V_02730 [Salipaludibacillus sp. HK11]|uniref:hypothetical protein n=1 Tax=Salipaludibacillus sp. HK11 TaxID=3394320 RepID=UPI0039FC0AFA
MSTYVNYVAEREKIDFLVEQDYIIKGVTENLSGAFLEFEYRGTDPQKNQIETLQILNADARKYFSMIIIDQQKQGI